MTVLLVLTVAIISYDVYLPYYLIITLLSLINNNLTVSSLINNNLNHYCGYLTISD